MTKAQYYVGKYRVDFGVLISPESIIELERMAGANGIVVPENCDMYDLMRGYHGSYCYCQVKRHPDGTFAVVELCRGHLEERQDEADERARASAGGMMALLRKHSQRGIRAANAAKDHLSTGRIVASSLDASQALPNA